MTQSKSIDPRQVFNDVLQAFWRHRLAVLACLVLTPLAAYVAGRTADPQYVSRASLLVKLGREFQVPTGIGGRGLSMYRLNEALNSELEILSSRQLAGEVIDELGTEVLFPKLPAKHTDPDVERAAAIEAFLEALSTEGIAESSVIEVAFVHMDPKVARRSVEVLVDRFQRMHLEVFGEETVPMAQHEVDTLRAALDDAEARRNSYRSENGIYDESEQRALLLRRRDTLEAMRLSMEKRLERLRDGGSSVESSTASRAEVELEAELLRLRAEEQQLLQDYFPESRAVQAHREKIQAQEGLLSEARSVAAAASAQELAAVRLELADIDEELQALASHERSLREIERDVEQLSARYTAAVVELGDVSARASLDDAMVTSVRLIDPPTLPIEPIGLGLLARLALATIAGCILAASTVLLLVLVEVRPQDRAVSAS